MLSWEMSTFFSTISVHIQRKQLRSQENDYVASYSYRKAAALGSGYLGQDSETFAMASPPEGIFLVNYFMCEW